MVLVLVYWGVVEISTTEKYLSEKSKIQTIDILAIVKTHESFRDQKRELTLG